MDKAIKKDLDDNEDKDTLEAEDLVRAARQASALVEKEQEKEQGTQSKTPSPTQSELGTRTQPGSGSSNPKRANNDNEDQSPPSLTRRPNLTLPGAFAAAGVGGVEGGNGDSHNHETGNGTNVGSIGSATRRVNANSNDAVVLSTAPPTTTSRTATSSTVGLEDDDEENAYQRQEKAIIPEAELVVEGDTNNLNNPLNAHSTPTTPEVYKAQAVLEGSGNNNGNENGMSNRKKRCLLVGGTILGCLCLCAVAATAVVVTLVVQDRNAESSSDDPDDVFTHYAAFYGVKAPEHCHLTPKRGDEIKVTRSVATLYLSCSGIRLTLVGPQTSNADCRDQGKDTLACDLSSPQNQQPDGPRLVTWSCKTRLDGDNSDEDTEVSAYLNSAKFECGTDVEFNESIGVDSYGTLAQYLSVNQLCQDNDVLHKQGCTYNENATMGLLGCVTERPASCSNCSLESASVSWQHQGSGGLDSDKNVCLWDQVNDFMDYRLGPDKLLEHLKNVSLSLRVAENNNDVR